VWRATSRINRHQNEHLVKTMLAIIDELDAQRRGVEHAVLNRGTGQQVVNWYGPVLRQALSGAEFDALVESVSTDVGDLLFPRFDRFILPKLRAEGRWEPDEAEFVRAHLRPGGRALNVGANVGYTTLVMAQAAGPSGLVIAIEPEPFNFNLLWTNIRRNRAYNVLPVHTAAGETTGSTWLNLSPDNTGDHRTAPHPIGVGRLEVPMVALDDLIGDVDVDLIVSDAQGYDHRILRGMTMLVKRCHPPMLVEFWPPGILELGDNPVDVVEEYRSLGYRMRIVEGDRDVTDESAESVVGLVLERGDHATLALT
jgi:FkbM family methyltransferase